MSNYGLNSKRTNKIKGQLKKPKYIIYAGLLIFVVLWFLHAEFATDVKHKYLGTVKKGELIKCDNFNESLPLRECRQYKFCI